MRNHPQIYRFAAVQLDQLLKSPWWIVCREKFLNSFIHLPNAVQCVRHCARLMKCKLIRSLTLELEIQWMCEEQLGGCCNMQQAITVAWMGVLRYWRWGSREVDLLRVRLLGMDGQERENSRKRFVLWLRPQGGWWRHLLRGRYCGRSRCGQRGN